MGGRRSGKVNGRHPLRTVQRRQRSHDLPVHERVSPAGRPPWQRRQSHDRRRHVRARGTEVTAAVESSGGARLKNDLHVHLLRVVSSYTNTSNPCRGGGPSWQISLTVP